MRAFAAFAVFALSCLTAASAFEITLHLPLRNEDELDASFWAVSTPSSPRMGKFMSLSELVSQHGADKAHIKGATEWCKNSGTQEVTISNLKDSVTCVFDKSGHALNLSKAGHPVDAPDFVLFSVRRDAVESTYVSPWQDFGADDLREYCVSNIKDAYGMPTDLTATNPSTSVMTWGPGTFGYSKAELERFKLTQAPLINMDKVIFDTENHGEQGGDNFGEGQLDVNMLSSFALNATVLVSNTNTSSSTEETTGFGAALLDFLTGLAARETVPHVLSMSLGSLSATSCDLLKESAKAGGFTSQEADDYLATQR